MWEQLAAGVMQDTVGGGVGRSEAHGGTTNQSFNISPIGLNLGEILRPFNEGSFTNGGYGIKLPSRYDGGGNQLVDQSLAGAIQSFPWTTVLLVGAGGLLLLKIYKGG